MLQILERLSANEDYQPLTILPENEAWLFCVLRESYYQNVLQLPTYELITEPYEIIPTTTNLES